MASPSGTLAFPPASPPATAPNVPSSPTPVTGRHVYVPWMPFTSGADADGPERTKNVHARAKTMASATRVTAKLGGLRLNRAERISRLTRFGGVTISLAAGRPTRRTGAATAG